MITYLYFYTAVFLTIELNIIALKHLDRRWMLWLVHGTSFVYILAFMWFATDTQEWQWFYDFTKAYYPAGRAIVEEPSRLYASSMGCGEKSICNYVNIPIVALMFTPLSYLSLPMAHLLLGLLSVICVAVTIYGLIALNKISDKRKCAILLLFAINGPLYYSIQEGNLTHFVLLLLVAAVVCLGKRQDAWSGAFFALAAVIKPPLLLVGMYFCLRRRWNVVVGFGETFLAVVGGSMLLAGFDVHIAWYQESVQPFSDAALGAFNVQSIDGFLMRLRDDADLYNWTLVEVGWRFKTLRYVLLLMLLGGSLWICLRSSVNNLRAQYTELSIVLCLALIASPISWTHYYLFLLLPLSLYFGNKLDIPNRGVWFSLMAASALLISPPVVIVGNNLSILGPLASKLLISHYLFGGLLLLGILLAARLRGTGVYQESLVRATANDPELNRTSPINSKKELEKGGYRTH